MNGAGALEHQTFSSCSTAAVSARTFRQSSASASGIHSASLCLSSHIFHAVIAVMRRECRVALAQKCDMLGAPDETHVRNGMDEGFGVRDGAFLDEIGPQLPREVELDVHLERLGNVDAAVAVLRRVVKLAQRRVPG